MKPKLIELVLPCGSWQEAQRIADVLLHKRFIASATFIPVKSMHRSQGEIESAKEVMLLMESLAAYFDKVEAEVIKLHSYETFNLKAVPVEHISKKALEWLDVELRNKT